MKLTSQHINQLHKFTRAHYVEWYDLQTELVDHLANDIEHIWEENSKLTFNQAKNKAFKKFGIFGFNDVIGQRHNALYKQYWKMVWKIFKDYFKLPKIVLTMLISAIIFTILNILSSKNIFIYSYLAIHIILILGFLIREQIQIKRKNKITGKKWMFDNIITSMGGIGFLMYMPLQVFSHFTNLNWSLKNQIIVSVILALFSILSYILVKIIPKEMIKKMENQYPEYKLYKKA